MKTFKNSLTVAIVAALGTVTAYGQQAPMYTHYMYNTLTVNPAYAGSRDALSVTALHRSQWVDFTGAPMTQTLTLHGPLQFQPIGLGLSVSNDKIGPTNNTSAFANVAYMMKINDKSKLSFGLSGGINIFQARLSSLQLDQQSDPTFQNVNNRVTPNFGFGMYYSRERFYAGVSAPNLIENSYSSVKQADGSESIGKEHRHYFLIAGAVFRLADNLDFKPTTLLKVTAAAPAQMDVTASFIIMQRLLLGAMFRTGDAVGALVGFDLTNQLHIGYSFDWSYGMRTFKYNNGSHEIMLRYDFMGTGKKQIHSPKPF